MGQFFIVLAGALVLGAVVFGVTVLIVGGDQGLEPAEPDGRAVPLPAARPLTETDLGAVRFDLAFRGYRMAQVDQALRRSAYDLGYKEELIGVLEAEVEALRDGRLEEAEKLRAARLAAARPVAAAAAEGDGAEPDDADFEDGGFEDGGFEDGASGDRESGVGLREARSDGRADRSGGPASIDLGLISDASAGEPAK
jgi:DivIVA domain-containing protein